MTAEIIVKKPAGKIAPNLADYGVAQAEFSWDAARRSLDGLPHGGGLNIAHEAVDRHAQGSRADHLALRWLGKSGAVRDFTYRDLGLETSRFANVLAGLGVQAGERVFILAGRWYRILSEQQVSVWYTAPTAVRMMMKGGTELARRHDFPHLRFIASVGEPLNPQAVRWGEQAFGLPIHDNWWQTETGGIMIANYAAMDNQARLDGQAAPGCRCRDRQARCRRRSRSDRCAGCPRLLARPRRLDAFVRRSDQILRR